MRSNIFIEDFAHIASLALPWEKFVNKTILIAGANGFIASYLIEMLLYLNEQKSLRITIIGISRNKKKASQRFFAYKNRSDLKIIIQDISTPIEIKEKVHFIIHAASQASPKYYSVDPVGTLRANVLGTYNLLAFVQKQPIESFLYISTGEIYGSLQTNGLTNETTYGSLDPTDVRSCYAESKRLGETMCVAWYHQYKIPTKIVRLYHTYGPGIQLDDGRVFADFISNIIRGRDIVLKSDGVAIRSFCYIADAICGLLTVLLKGKNGEAYNLANEKATVSINELAKILISLFPEKKLKILFKERSKNDAYLPSKIMINRPNTKKLQSLGWEPNFSLEKGFLRTIRSFTQA